MKKKIVFLDVDGTIYDNEKKVVLKSTIEALNKLQANPEVELALATGRSLSSLGIIKNYLHFFKIKILSNGSYCLDGEKEIIKDFLNKNKVSEFVAYLEKNKILYGLIGDKLHAISGDHPNWEYVFSLFGIEVPEIDPKFHLNNDIYQLWIFGNLDKRATFSKMFPEFRFVPWPYDGMDVISHNCSKGEAIKKIKENNVWDEIIAIGDGLNDLEMFNEADIKIAMGQGHAELKQRSTFVTDTIENDGLYKAFEKLGLI